VMIGRQYRRNSKRVCFQGSLTLIETHRQYNARLWRARFISSRLKTGRKKTLRQHDDIVVAFAKRDAKATGQAMRVHLEAAIENIKKAKATPAAKG